MVQLLESQDGSEDISKKVWEILMVVPSQPEILARMEKTMAISCQNITEESDDDELTENLPQATGVFVWGSKFHSSSGNQVLAT